MARFLSFAALASLVAAAGAQTTPPEKLGVHLKVSYFITPSFKLRDGSSNHLEGPMVALDVPIQRYHGFDLYFTPAIGMGGRLKHGSDIDGDVYSFSLLARKTLSPNGTYGTLAGGFGHTVGRGSDLFRDANGFVGGVTIGFPLKGMRFIGQFTPALEAGYNYSSQPQLRSITFGLNFGF